MRYLLALAVLLFLLLYVVPNIFRYPWHTLVFVVFGVALTLLAGGGSRLKARIDASPHPAVRRLAAAYATFIAVVEGVPPYKEGRWWIVRTLAQLAFYTVTVTAILAVLAALGGVFVWLDGVTK